MKPTAAHIQIVGWLWVGLMSLLPLQAQQYAGDEGFYFNYLHQQYPDFRVRSSALERQIQQYVLNHSENRNDQVFTIPVVIHVVHLPKDTFPQRGTSNPPDDQVMRGLQWLNDAFRNVQLFQGGPDFTNATEIKNVVDSASLPFSVDTKIEFCLARSDDDGNLISGINRVSSRWSNINLYGQGEVDSGYYPEPLLLQWSTPTQDMDEVLNIWLVNSVCENIRQGCHIEGYAYPPAWSDSTTDGVVVENAYWGSAPDSQAASIFYVGQYLGLFPTYHERVCPSDDPSQAISCLSHGDKVCDTPPDNTPGGPSCGGAIIQRVNTCNTDLNLLGTPYTKDVEDMITNFMDYGFMMGCHNTFTRGQATRMRAVLNTARLKLRLSDRCAIPFKNLSVIQIDNPRDVACGQKIYPSVTVHNTGNQKISKLQLAFKDENGNEVIENWNGEVLPGDSVTIDFNTPIQGLSTGRHLGEAKIKLIDGQVTDADPQDNVLVRPFWILEPGVPVRSFPYCADMSGGGLPAFWQKVDFDKLLTFDVYNQANCVDEHGDFILRYNSSGAFNGGSGITAGLNGTRDLLVTPILDLTTEDYAALSFQYAHKFLDGPRKARLSIHVTDDCGTRLETLLVLQGRDLETSQSPDDFGLIGWEPETCADWDSVSLSLNEFIGSRIRVQFELALEGTHTQNFYLDNICISPKPPCNKPDYVPSSPGIFVADLMCTEDSTGWKHYIKTANNSPQTATDVLLFSILDTGANALNIQPQQVQMVITNQYQKGGHSLGGKAVYAENLRGWHAMGRYVKIDGAPQIVQKLPVRFYFDRLDWDDMKQAIAPAQINKEENLVFYSINQPFDNRLEDDHRGILEGAYAQYRHESFTSERTYTLQRENAYFAAEFLADDLTYFGGGTGGYGLAMGARYPVMPFDIVGGIQDGQIILDWKTRREWEMNTFEVYHSTDNIDFAQLGEVASVGFAQQASQYAFAHETPSEGINHYYVKLTHANGVEVITDTLTVLFDPEQAVRVFPNPVQDILQVSVDAPADTPVRFTIKNGQNQHILDTYWTQSGGPFSVDVSHLVPGMYFYTVVFNEIELWGKLVLEP